MQSFNNEWFYIDSKKMGNPDIALLFQNVNKWIQSCISNVPTVIQTIQSVTKNDFQAFGYKTLSWFKTGDANLLDEVLNSCRNDEIKAISFFMLLRIVHFEPPCDKCSNETTFSKNKRPSLANTWIWKLGISIFYVFDFFVLNIFFCLCHIHRCNSGHITNLRHRSIFHNHSKICFTDFIKSMHGFVLDCKQKYSSEFTIIHEKVVSEVVRSFKNCIYVMQQHIGLQLGGDGNTIQTDHTFLNGHKRKYNRGAINKKKNCTIQSAYDMSNSLVVFKNVPNIRRPCVSSVAEEQIRNDTVIWSDLDKNLATLGENTDKQWTHDTCNHSGTINPLTGHVT